MMALWMVPAMLVAFEWDGYDFWADIFFTQ